jgi:hypothetical protein
MPGEDDENMHIPTSKALAQSHSHQAAASVSHSTLVKT